MPYKSQAQMAYMHFQHPEIAARWDKKYSVPADLPDRKAAAYKRAAEREGARK